MYQQSPLNPVTTALIYNRMVVGNTLLRSRLCWL
uniref:Uncharacterized protein n=1 Tax=Schistosoma japonicum TaxID=6182 RepID=Q5C0W8_SCHJA|nr:unknown [Schistosoma japonicum]